MSRKTLLAIICGALAAGLVCLVAGLILYFTIKANPIALFIGVFMVAMGVFMSAVAILMLIILLVVNLVSKHKNK